MRRGEGRRLREPDAPAVHAPSLAALSSMQVESPSTPAASAFGVLRW